MPEFVETTCLLCGTNSHAVVLFEQNFSPTDLSGQTFSARRTTEHYHYRFLKCKNCGLVFSSPILPQEEVTKLYIASSQTYDNEVDAISRSYIQYIQKYKEKFAFQRALEIGCGSGFFLAALKKIGYKEVYGVEPSREAVQKSGELRPFIYNGIFEEAEYPKNSFDLICCFQTLDHLVDPLSALRKIADLLAPQGIAYIIVHNQQAFQAKVFGEKSPIYDVEHIYLFNKETLPKVGKRAGLDTVKIFSVRNSFPLSYWLRMSPLPMKSVLQKMASALGLSRATIGIYPGNIGILLTKITS